MKVKRDSHPHISQGQIQEDLDPSIEKHFYYFRRPSPFPRLHVSENIGLGCPKYPLFTRLQGLFTKPVANYLQGQKTFLNFSI